MDGKKAQAFIWLGIIVLIFSMGALYTIFNVPIEKVQNLTVENITGSQYEQSYLQQKTVWDYFLWVFLFGIFMFGVLTSMRKRDETY